MIPKIIHFCWLSDDPYPEHIKECIDSWHKYLPDYEFIHWNFDRFPHGKSQWVDQAFSHHKYAFAADYIRLYALYHHGGIYLDCDVEVLSSFDPFLGLKTMMCWQKGIPGLEVAAFGVEKHSEWVKDCLDAYDGLSFIDGNGNFDIQVLPERIEECLLKKNYKLSEISSINDAYATQNDGFIPVFAPEFFSPKSYRTKKIDVTSNTVCIHHFDGSWKKPTWYEIIDKIFARIFRCRNFHYASNAMRLWRKYIQMLKK